MLIKIIIILLKFFKNNFYFTKPYKKSLSKKFFKKKKNSIFLNHILPLIIKLVLFFIFYSLFLEYVYVYWPRFLKWFVFEEGLWYMYNYPNKYELLDRERLFERYNIKTEKWSFRDFFRWDIEKEYWDGWKFVCLKTSSNLLGVWKIIYIFFLKIFYFFITVFKNLILIFLSILYKILTNFFSGVSVREGLNQLYAQPHSYLFIFSFYIFFIVIFYLYFLYQINYSLLSFRLKLAELVDGGNKIENSEIKTLKHKIYVYKFCLIFYNFVVFFIILNSYIIVVFFIFFLIKLIINWRYDVSLTKGVERYLDYEKKSFVCTNIKLHVEMLLINKSLQPISIDVHEIKNTKKFKFFELRIQDSDDEDSEDDSFKDSLSLQSKDSLENSLYFENLTSFFKNYLTKNFYKNPIKPTLENLNYFKKPKNINQTLQSIEDVGQFIINFQNYQIETRNINKRYKKFKINSNYTKNMVVKKLGTGYLNNKKVEHEELNIEPDLHPDLNELSLNLNELQIIKNETPENSIPLNLLTYSSTELEFDLEEEVWRFDNSVEGYYKYLNNASWQKTYESIFSSLVVSRGYGYALYRYKKTRLDFKPDAKQYHFNFERYFYYHSVVRKRDTHLKLLRAKQGFNNFEEYGFERLHMFDTAYWDQWLIDKKVLEKRYKSLNIKSQENFWLCTFLSFADSAKYVIPNFLLHPMDEHFLPSQSFIFDHSTYSFVDSLRHRFKSESRCVIKPTNLNLVYQYDYIDWRNHNYSYTTRFKELNPFNYLSDDGVVPWNHETTSDTDSDLSDDYLENFKRTKVT